MMKTPPSWLTRPWPSGVDTGEGRGGETGAQGEGGEEAQAAPLGSSFPGAPRPLTALSSPRSLVGSCGRSVIRKKSPEVEGGSCRDGGGHSWLHESPVQSAASPATQVAGLGPLRRAGRARGSLGALGPMALWPPGCSLGSGLSWQDLGGKMWPIRPAPRSKRSRGFRVSGARRSGGWLVLTAPFSRHPNGTAEDR